MDHIECVAAAATVRLLHGKRSVCWGLSSGHRAVLRGRDVPVRGQAAGEQQEWRTLQVSSRWHELPRQ